MKKTVFSSIAVLILASSANIFAQDTKAVDQLSDQQETCAAVAPAAKPEHTGIAFGEKGNPIVDALFGLGQNNNQNNAWNNGNYGQHGYPGQYGQYTRMTCRATDNGWEEHWGGHGFGPDERDTCRACLSAHGSCRYNCTVPYFRCTAKFFPVQPPAAPGQVQPPAPAPLNYTGDLRPDEWAARDSAMLQCYQSTQGMQGNCAAATCDRQEQTVKRGDCRK
ncbi:MAG: hypothetical protein COX65_08255 [Elusimicrobia bacterium CG_4_10_14_0_2_um_filter_56_8]|nr:MAG: hypothetical protein COX65_08255 [Elusimicrobia bacterium CG_4_10_14_0_2_um_filter_56_8]